MERVSRISRQLAWALSLTVVLGVLASTAGGAITLEMVTVGDPGNVGQLSGSEDGGYGPARVCGAVPYVYQIGRYEVTNAQYRAFLNSVARGGDPYALYSSSSWGIQRTGTGTVGDPYVYISKNSDPNWDTRPVNYVSWYTSLRFVNWLQNGQPIAEAGPGVTETGTYTFSDPSAVAIPDHFALTTPDYVLPTEDEWYKAAYYKGGGTAAGYWDSPTQSDARPDNSPPWLDTGNSANCRVDDHDPSTDDHAVGPPYYLTDVGAYTLSESAYETYDQEGNVREILENTFGGSGHQLRQAWVRGGSWDSGPLPAVLRGLSVDADVGTDLHGFRVALVPDPSGVGLLAAGWIALSTRRRVAFRGK